MNPRIKELMAQTGMPVSVPSDVWCARFAELIIQECLLSLEPDLYTSDIDYDVEQKFYQRSARKIQQHFGVYK